MLFNQEREQKRAAFAFRLTKWLDEDGEKLSEDENGISAHQDAVEFYEAIYGPLSEGGRRQYDNLYRNIRKGLQDDRENQERSQAIMQRYNDKKEQEAAEQAHQREVRAAISGLRNAKNAISRTEVQESLLRGQIIPQSESQVDILTNDTARLRSMLSRYEPGGRRHDMLLEEVAKNEKMLGNVSSDLSKQRDELEKCFQTTRECQATISRCQSILSGEEDDGSESVDIAFGADANADIAGDDRDMEFILKSNHWYHPAGPRASAFVASLGYSRDNGSAFAVSPDGRVKAWPDSGPVDVSINRVALHFVDMGSYLQCQLDTVQVQQLVGAVYQPE